MIVSIIRDGDYLVITYIDGTVERRYWPDGTPAYIPPRGVTLLEIRRALTSAERAAIRAAAASDDNVMDWLEELQSAACATFRGDDQRLRAGFLYLRDLGIFTTQRLQELQALLLD